MYENFGSNLAEYRRQDLLRQAQQQRLIRQLEQERTRRPGFYRRVLTWIGHLLVH